MFNSVGYAGFEGFLALKEILSNKYATQPCPCGYYNHPEKECVCGPGVVKRYLSKISGPLLDRIDLHVEVTPVKIEELTNAERPKMTSADIRIEDLAEAIHCRRLDRKGWTG